MQFWTDLLTSPTIIIAALIIGTMGEVAKKLVNAKGGDRGWRGIYFVTLPAHPVIAGILMGCIPFLPPADALHKDGFDTASRIATYALAGVVCKIGYDSIISTIKRLIAQRTGVAGATEAARSAAVARLSSAPPVAPDVTTEPETTTEPPAT